MNSGYRWQVGDGKSIDIWIDRWLPRPSTFRVLTPPAQLPANTRVESLIDQENGDWNLDLIHQTFLQDDATSILSIPLSRHKPQDRMIWAYTPKGRFTVNSTYKVAISITQTSRLAKTFHDSEQSQFWCKLWDLHVPNNTKLFAWRACKNILPTKANLYHKGVIDDPTCEAYALAPETVGHLF